MSQPGIPASVLQRLPGWADAESSLLTGGQSNHTWLLQKHGARAVLKFDEELRSAPYNSRHDEARVQAAAAEQGLATAVLYVDDRVLLSEYAEGEVWNPESLSDERNLERLADALRRLHALPSTGRRFDPLAAAEIYAGKIEGDRELVALCMGIAAAAGRPKRSCCCHNDLVAENIIATPEVRFLDWEYACDNDPLFDLATVVEHHALSESCTEHLLRAYFGDDSGRSGLLEQQRLYQALLWLWLASRPDSREADRVRAAERLLTSCS